jgi:uncharacterized membrane protein YhiD involved in acid resistance
MEQSTDQSVNQAFEQAFQQFLATSSPIIPVVDFVLNIFLSVILAALVGWVYTRYGTSLSNRRKFSKNFVIMAMTTTLVITIVKSSLALSLGLVGALSIVRFRAAIKEPEELGFLFLAIAIGLGLGANQRSITVIAITIILIVIILTRISAPDAGDEQDLNLVIKSQNSSTLNIDDLVVSLRKYCDRIDLMRLDDSEGIIEAVFKVDISDVSQIVSLRNDLAMLDKDIHITFLDNKGLI